MDGKEKNVVDLSSPLTIYNATEAALAEIKQKYQGLTITGVDDKDGYKAVSEGLRVVVGLRNKVDKRRQELKRHIDNGSKQILNELAPVETALRLQKDRIDNEVERIKQEKAEAERLKFVARTEKLFSIGFSFNGAIYVLGHHAIGPQEIAGKSDEEWNDLLPLFEQTAENIAAQKLFEDNEAARLKEENERLRRELDAKKAAEANIQDLKRSGAIADGNVTSVQADPEGVTVNTVIQTHKPAVSITVPVRFEDGISVKDDENDKPGTARTPYQLGFDACRLDVLGILSQTGPLTRKGLIEAITNLKPQPWTNQ